MKLCDRCGRCLLVREVLYHEIAKSLGLCSFSCYDEKMSDMLEPVIAQIKAGRLQGLDDTELEQQLLLGGWTEQEIQAGKNFLHFTQRSASLNEPMAQDVLHKEEVFRRRKVQKNFLLHWALPVGVIGGLSIVVGLFLNNFLYSHATDTPTPPLVTSVDSPISVFSPTSTTPAPVSAITPTSPVVPTTNQGETANTSSQIRVRGMVVCTQDKKVCTSGKMVGRTPPTCEFAACPE